MNEQIGLGRIVGQGVGVPQTTRESIINRLHAINARTVNLSKKIEVLEPILRNELGAQDSKQVSEPERKLPRSIMRSGRLPIRWSTAYESSRTPGSRRTLISLREKRT